MAKNEQPNPIYERLTRNTRGPSKRFLRWLSIGIGAVTLLTALALLDYNLKLAVPILLFIGSLDVISPAVIAVYAANLAYRDLPEENVQMLKLAGITENTIIKGYAEAAFHRLRLLAAVATSLVPTLLIAGSLATLVAWPGRDVDLVDIAILQLSILPAVVLLSFGLWFFQKLGSICGAFLAIWWKHPIPAMIAGALAMLILQPVALNTVSKILFDPLMTLYITLSSLAENLK